MGPLLQFVELFTFQSLKSWVAAVATRPLQLVDCRRAPLAAMISISLRGPYRE